MIKLVLSFYSDNPWLFIIPWNPQIYLFYLLLFKLPCLSPLARYRMLAAFLLALALDSNLLLCDSLSHSIISILEPRPAHSMWLLGHTAKIWHTLFISEVTAKDLLFQREFYHLQKDMTSGKLGFSAYWALTWFLQESDFKPSLCLHVFACACFMLFNDVMGKTEMISVILSASQSNTMQFPLDIKRMSLTDWWSSILSFSGTKTLKFSLIGWNVSSFPLVMPEILYIYPQCPV